MEICSRLFFHIFTFVKIFCQKHGIIQVNIWHDLIFCICHIRLKSQHIHRKIIFKILFRSDLFIRNISSLKYTKFSARPGILCIFHSMACELNVGRYFSGIKSLWFTIFNFGCSLFNQDGRCPHVTKCILRTHGAKRSTPRNQYLSRSQSLYLSFLSSCFCDRSGRDTVLHFLFLPVRIIAIYPCDHKINFRNVIVACHNNLHFCPANIFFICLINFTVIMIKQILQNENPIYLLNLYFLRNTGFSLF